MSAPSNRGRTRGGDPVLVVYHRPSRGQFVDSDSVREHIDAFRRHSRHPVWAVNTDFGLPPGIDRVSFAAIVVHYSVCLTGAQPYLLEGGFREYIAASGAYKIASFHDEHHWCAKRFSFLNECGIDCVLSCLDQSEGERVYCERTGVRRVVSCLPGYVSPEMTAAAERLRKPQAGRPVDIGYRGRWTPAYMGAGGQEKWVIGERFAELARDRGLRLDIAVGEEDRIYGKAWHRFLADSVGTLGVESGVSCFDLEDEVRHRYEQLAVGGHEPTLAELQPELGRWDNKIPYRTISARHFEAAAFDVCQVLFEGSYSELMAPMRHYIPLRKDFSNIDEVIERFNDPGLRRELTSNARRDLIVSGDNSYAAFIELFDSVLEEAGLEAGDGDLSRPAIDIALRATLGVRLRHWVRRRWAGTQANPVLGPIVWVLSRPLAVPLRLLQRR